MARFDFYIVYTRLSGHLQAVYIGQVQIFNCLQRSKRYLMNHLADVLKENGYVQKNVNYI